MGCNVKNLYEMSAEELGRLFPIAIVEYDDTWPLLYRDERLHVQSVLGRKLALSIEHFGSTAVPGLAAKPTIDILLETPSDMDDEIIRRMTKSGYEFIRLEDSPPSIYDVCERL